MNIYDVLKERGLVEQTTNEEKIREALGKEKVAFYIGFDTTADSLHVGHYLQLVIMRRMQNAGHMPIILIGDGTTLVGDPTGKTDMRKMLSPEDIAHNSECFLKQMSKFVDLSEGKALVVHNKDWLCEVKYLDFLREIGVHFSVNRMLTAECFKTRLEKGLSFIEFNYMLMQSYDFLHLYRKYGCKMELGGNDQWSNILGGVDLVRRVTAEEVYGMTFTLLTTKEGKKMGKTESGAVWLNPEKTSPYEFFQYWRNIDDGDVTNCLRLLTDIPLDVIAKYDDKDSNINEAKEMLAYDLTKTVHSEADAKNALDAAKALFSTGGDLKSMPSTQLMDSDFANGTIDVLDLIVKCGLAASRGEARRLVEQGGISLGNEKVTDVFSKIGENEFCGDGAIIKKGKKIFHRAFK
ncbi:MAG: tyrosine--tRNA ligase [Oscillospiraceae bacterium]